MRTTLELLEAIKIRDIKNKIKTGSFFLSDELRADIQRLLGIAPNNEYKQCEHDYESVDIDSFKCNKCGCIKTEVY